MLSDADRIFTNLYGWEPASLNDAQKRGDWDNTAGLIANGSAWIIEEMKTSGLRGRGSRFPDGS